MAIFAALATTVSCGPGDPALTTSETDATGEPGTAGTDEPTSSATGTSDTPTTSTTVTTTTEEAPTTGDDTGTTTEEEPPPPPAVCVVTPGDHTMAVCDGGVCPIGNDVELRCDGYNFAAPGVHAAATPDAMWLATAGEAEPMMYRVTAGDVAERIAVPPGFARQTIHLATGPQGDLHVATQVGLDENLQSNVIYLSEAGGFAEQVVHTKDGGAPIAGFQVGPDGMPRLFVFDGPDSYSEAASDGKGGWTLTPVTILDGGYGTPRFGRDAQDRLLAADIREVKGLYRLGVEVDGALVNLGKGLNSLSASQHFVLAPTASPTPPVGPPFAALYESAGGIEVGWPLGGDTSDAMKIPGFTQLEVTCNEAEFPDEGTPCPGPCHETGLGIEHGTTSFARSPDGLAWATIVTTQLDYTVTYELTREREDAGGAYCRGTISEDVSTSVLHVIRVTLDDTPPVEVLTLPMARLASEDTYAEFANSLIATHTHAFADSLAIGLRLRDTEPDRYVARALRIELATLAP